jgi:hypothetical protein
MNESSKYIALEELRRAFERSWAASDILDGKLQNILNFSSIIIAVASTISGSALLDKVGISFWCLLLVATILYLIVFYVIMRGLKPHSYLSPISEDPKEIEEKYYNWPKDRAIRQAIHDYLKFTKDLATINSPKVKAVVLSSYLMGAIVVLLLIAIPVGLTWSTPTLHCFLHLASCAIGARP